MAPELLNEQTHIVNGQEDGNLATELIVIVVSISDTTAERLLWAILEYFCIIHGPTVGL